MSGSSTRRCRKLFIVPFATQGKFTAREDDATGLYYYRARYYQPVLGRFVSEDPLESVLRVLAESVTKSTADNDLFVYGYDSPLMFTDPLGLWTFSFGSDLSGGVGAGGHGFTGIAFSYSSDCGFQIGGIYTAGLGGYAGVGGGFQGQVGFSGNRSITDLSGFSGEVGVGGGEGVVAGANINFQASGAAPVYSGSVGFGGGLTPVDAHAYGNWTAVNQWWSSRGNERCGCR
jgi:RHS repeat-associated protein